MNRKLDRSLFPEENYRNEEIEALPVKTLQRGYSQEADTLLDWMELGIFDALERKYLRAILLGIHLDPESPDRLSECYTFKVTYPHDDNAAHINIEHEVMGGSNKKQSVLNTAKGSSTTPLNKEELAKVVRQLIRRLIIITQTLKPLPDNRYISMKLYYCDERTPPDYEPPMFKAGDAQKDIFAFPEKPEEHIVGSLATTYHSIRMHVSTLADSMDVPSEDVLNHLSTQDFESTVMANSDLENKVPTRWYADEEFQQQEGQSEPLEGMIDADGNNLNMSQESLVPTMLLDSEGTLRPIEMLTGLETTMEDCVIGATEASDANARSDQPMDIQLQDSNSQTPADHEQQTLLTTDSVVPSKPQEKPIAKYGRRSRRIAEVAKRDNGQPPKAQADSQVTEILEQQPLPKMPMTPKGICNCDCGVQKPDDYMLKCNACESFGHVYCYGYNYLSDPARVKMILNTHRCYSCIKQQMIEDDIYDTFKTDPSGLINLEMMQDIALLRRAVWIVWHEGYGATFREFAATVGLSLVEARRVQERLKHEGYLVEVNQPKDLKRNGSMRSKRSNPNALKVWKNTTTRRYFHALFDPSLGLPPSVQPPGSNIKSDGRIAACQAKIINKHTHISAQSEVSMQAPTDSVPEKPAQADDVDMGATDTTVRSEQDRDNYSEAETCSDGDEPSPVFEPAKQTQASDARMENIQSEERDVIMAFDSQASLGEPANLAKRRKISVTPRPINVL
ncbi:hypothetical protein BZG36_04002 [Bifiguratus adelaidae]|uniref:HORMA domain-containing protein n=1 Tax=Bifiguratus adelaidae TaxID=1938954 RepID=A0A261XYE2_9FUNG|nr:hypothetical protein BZG36_04002 [Bifiguratus adelaidae]